ncbi:MAG: general secretion pathway protein GspK [Synergistaceae bacterium]|nr:general secretion pathway protein GspK [Synergistaceae bacterium]
MRDLLFSHNKRRAFFLVSVNIRRFFSGFFVRKSGVSGINSFSHNDHKGFMLVCVLMRRFCSGFSVRRSGVSGINSFSHNDHKGFMLVRVLMRRFCSSFLVHRSGAFSRNRHKGFVLVSVLMLGVMLISCATAFSWFVRSQVRSAGRESINITNRSMAHVLTNSVMNILSEVSNHYSYDSPLQRWYKPFVIPIEDLGIWVIQITPLDDKIPLRNLFLPDGTTLRRELNEAWENMWEKLDKRGLENLILDFLDRNNRARVGSVEEEYFINRGPYDISELLILSNDITPSLLYGSGGKLGLSDYCTIYSEGRINLNVAPVHVMELLPGLENGLADRIARARIEEPIEKLSDLTKLPGASAKTSTQLTNIAAFKSRYCMMKIECLNEDGEGGTSFTIIFDKTTRQIVKWEEA